MFCRRMGLLWRYLVVRAAKEVSIADGIKLNGLFGQFEGYWRLDGVLV